VEKKINKPFHPEADSDSTNNNDDNDECVSDNAIDDNAMEVAKNEKNIGPSEMDVDDNFIAPESSKLNVFECDKTLKED